MGSSFKLDTFFCFWMIHKTVLSGLTATTKKAFIWLGWKAADVKQQNLWKTFREQQLHQPSYSKKQPHNRSESSCLVCGLWLHRSRFGPLEKKNVANPLCRVWSLSFWLIGATRTYTYLIVWNICNISIHTWTLYIWQKINKSISSLCCTTW